MSQSRELGMQPDVVPAVEGGVGVAVVAGHARAQPVRLVGALGLADLGEAHLLDEHVRRDRDDRAAPVDGGVDQRDRRAVAVADEDGLVDLDGAEHGGQHLQRLLVHEARRARARRRVGVAVAEAGERDDARAGRIGQRGREVAPQPDRSEPLVQQHERRSVAWEVEDLEAAAIKLDVTIGSVLEK